MGALLDLSVDQLLTTTRAVRKRLDLTRPVERHLLEECFDLALQAPAGAVEQQWHFVVITDEKTKRALAAIYRRSWDVYLKLPPPESNTVETSDPIEARSQERVMASAAHLAQVIQDVPVLLVPCIDGRYENLPAIAQASMYGSIFPAVWSFMLAARSRGLGTCLTTLHLMFEAEAADILGIPYEKVTQASLVPVAHTIGTDFRPGPRRDRDRAVHWEQW